MSKACLHPRAAVSVNHHLRWKALLFFFHVRYTHLVRSKHVGDSLKLAILRKGERR
jgi:hypothetical protein